MQKILKENPWLYFFIPGAAVLLVIEIFFPMIGMLINGMFVVLSPFALVGIFIWRRSLALKQQEAIAPEIAEEPKKEKKKERKEKPTKKKKVE